MVIASLRTRRFCQHRRQIAKLTVLLEENTARNAEIDYNRFELANMDNSECKENDLPELAEALHLPERFSLLFSETKRIKPTDIGRASKK
mgnify:FL=1